jgi:hypothetical protein
MRVKTSGFGMGLAALALTLALAGPAGANNNDGFDQKDRRNVQDRCATNEKWMAGDFHNHTTFTDGSWPMNDLTAPGAIAASRVADPSGLYRQGTASTGFRNGLDFFANSEHGGKQSRDGFGAAWTTYTPNPAIGDPAGGQMWRWQSLLRTSDIPGYGALGLPEYMGAYDWIQSIRANYPQKIVMTGMEWNVPGHEHGSTGIVAKNALPIAEFEYRFDQSDTDGTSTTVTADTMGWRGKKQNDAYTTEYPVLGLNSLHDKTIDAVRWMQKHYGKTGWIVPAHVERKGCGGVGNPGYTVAAFRDMNDNGPDVAIGFEGIPGHQKSSSRGEFGSGACGGGTYGGAGFYIAEVGGLWDALLGDGRAFFNFASSDFHDTPNDFWPGEYQKTYVKVKGSGKHGAVDQYDIVDGIRSGNSFTVNGDLIRELDFKVLSDARHGQKSATMGGTLSVRKGETIVVRIRFKSPERNNCQAGVNASAGMVCADYPPAVHHVQLIEGNVNYKKAHKFLRDGSENPAYAVDTNPTAVVAKTFDASSWTVDCQGYTTMTFVVPKVHDDMYFRIRGTNKGYSEAGQTDEVGNPLLDVPGTNSADEAWKDLWFYSNPIFVNVTK